MSQTKAELVNGLSVNAAADDAITVDSSGRVLLGTTTEGHDNADDLTIATSGNTGITLRSGTSSAGNIYFSDATSGNGEFDGYLSYAQSVNKMFFGVNQANRMVIDSDGRLGVATTSPNSFAIATIRDANGLSLTGDTQTRLVFTHENGGTEQKNFDIQFDSGSLKFRKIGDNNTSVTECMRIKNDGNTVLDSAGRNFAHISQFTSTHDGGRFGLGIHNTNGGGGNQTAIRFMRNDSDVGSISTTGSATAFNTSSDYRLKENAVAISDGITRLKTLKPYRFNWKSNPATTVDGFFAHEVTAVPEAVTGTKDEVALADEELKGIKKGDAIYQSIDQSKLVPLLVAAVQEEIAKREALETRIAALEAA